MYSHRFNVIENVTGQAGPLEGSFAVASDERTFDSALADWFQHYGENPVPCIGLITEPQNPDIVQRLIAEHDLVLKGLFIAGSNPLKIQPGYDIPGSNLRTTLEMMGKRQRLLSAALSPQPELPSFLTPTLKDLHLRYGRATIRGLVCAFYAY